MTTNNTQLEELLENIGNLKVSDNCGGEMLIADDDVSAIMSLFTTLLSSERQEHEKELKLAKVEANIIMLRSLSNWWYTCDLAPSGSATMDRIGVALSELTTRKEMIENEKL